MVLQSEDYQFQQAVSFVRIDEYRNAQGRKYTPQHKKSMLRLNEQGQLLMCQSSSELDECIECFYSGTNLVKRIFTAKNSTRSVRREENRIYNARGLLAEKNFWEGESLQQSLHYSYNESSQLISEQSGNNTKIYLYDDVGLCKEEKIYLDSEPLKSLQYRYDDVGNIVEIWEESPIGKTSRLYRYGYNQQNLISSYQLVNQDGLILCNLEYKYNNFIAGDWLERYTWRLTGRSGKISYHSVESCLRSPCLEKNGQAEIEQHFRHGFKHLELPEGVYEGQTRIGIMHGYGCLNFYDGSSYIGDFDSGKMEGYGCFYWPDGRVYRGYFIANCMEGKGSYYLADGSLYQGDFCEGQLLSKKPYYYLAGDSPLTRQHRRNRLQAPKTENGQRNRDEDLAFIQEATRAVQEQRHEQKEGMAAVGAKAAGVQPRGPKVERTGQTLKEQDEAEQCKVRQEQIAHAKSRLVSPNPPSGESTNAKATDWEDLSLEGLQDSATKAGECTETQEASQFLATGIYDDDAEAASVSIEPYGDGQDKNYHKNYDENFGNAVDSEERIHCENDEIKQFRTSRSMAIDEPLYSDNQQLQKSLERELQQEFQVYLAEQSPQQEGGVQADALLPLAPGDCITDVPQEELKSDPFLRNL